MKNEFESALDYIKEKNLSNYYVARETALSQPAIKKITEGVGKPRTSTKEVIIDFVEREKSKKYNITDWSTQREDHRQSYFELIDMIDNLEKRGKIDSNEASKMKSHFMKIVGSVILNKS